MIPNNIIKKIMRKLKDWWSKISPNSTEKIANDLLQIIQFENTTNEQLEIFVLLSEKMESAMRAKENKSKLESELIRSYYPTLKNISRIDINDPIFNQPIKK